MYIVYIIYIIITGYHRIIYGGRCDSLEGQQSTLTNNCSPLSLAPQIVITTTKLPGLMILRDEGDPRSWL